MCEVFKEVGMIDKMKRRKSRIVRIGQVKIGGDRPVLVQAMTKTNTEDIRATIRQINQLSQAGAKIVRLAVPNARAIRALSRIKQEVKVPLVADVHFNHRLALEAIEQGVDKVRINPGNMGKEGILVIAKRAKEKKIPLRIGINSGSLEKDPLRDNLSWDEPGRQIIAQAMVKSALRSIRLLEEINFLDIVVSLKASDVLTTILSYQLISEKIPYPLHLGITAAGLPPQGIIKSSLTMGILLLQGIGDTLRVSLTGDPVEEVKTGYQILKSLDLSEDGPTLISCPVCGRCQVDLKSLAENVFSQIENIRVPLRVAVMGCEVNGPGEAREADIGVACMKGGGVIFKRGKRIKKVKEEDIVRTLLKEIEEIKNE